MLRRVILILTSIAVCFSLCGCDSISTSVNNMLSPPQLSEEQANIYDALEASVQQGDTLSLQSPKTAAIGPPL